MRMITGHNWGADRQSLINIYKALIRANIDYGIIVYNMVCKTRLEKIYRIQYSALRIAIGAMRTTPTSDLLVEPEEAPLKLRFIKLSLTYWVRLISSNSNPATSVLHECWEYHKKAKGFGWNINNIAEQFGIKEFDFSPAIALSEVPPWMLPFTVINTELLKEKREYQDDQSFAKYGQIYLS